MALFFSTMFLFSTVGYASDAQETEPIAETQAVPTITVQAITDKTYRDNVGNGGKLRNHIGYSLESFNNTYSWLDIRPHSTADDSLNGFGFLCSLGRRTKCTDAICGVGCTSRHHKNTTRNKNLIESKKSNWRWVLMATCHDFCDPASSPNSNIWGRGTMGPTKAASQIVSYTNGYLKYIQYIQHEISHGFGCPDGYGNSSCTSKCVMALDYHNGLTAYPTGNIWCSRCSGKFTTFKNLYQ